MMTIATLSCGCPRIYKASFGHTCIVHDERGKRWTDYTAAQVAALERAKVDVQTETTEWTCYCKRHDGKVMAVGTRCIRRKISYEYDEWECTCLAGNRDDWLLGVTTDWIAMARDMGQRVTDRATPPAPD